MALGQAQVQGSGFSGTVHSSGDTNTVSGQYTSKSGVYVSGSVSQETTQDGATSASVGVGVKRPI